MKVAKAGYFSGDPQKVLDANVEHVLTILDYENFQYDFERVYTEINREANK